MPYGNILFDLDGTLTDPAEGIIRCYQYSLGRLNRSCPSPEAIAAYIGPPIRRAFVELLQTGDEALVEQAVAIYRERFATVGLYENAVYEGVPGMLTRLRSQGYQLYVATSKPSVYAEKVLSHFSLSSYFKEVKGNELSGRLDDKAELVRELLEEQRLKAGETLMVGDRMHDVIAAKKNGLRSIGVTYGYGSAEELKGAGADHIAHAPEEILEILRGEEQV